MRRTIPPLNALKAFETAARHASFTLAADELCVTPAAVSQQVRALEERLSVALFERRNNVLELTETGLTYLPFISAAFDQMAQATSTLGEDGFEHDALFPRCWCGGKPDASGPEWAVADG